MAKIDKNVDPLDQTTTKPRIEYVPLDELVRAGRNPKEHDLGTIHQSMERFGFVSPILVNETTGRLVAGHGRLDTLQQRKAQGYPAPKRIVVSQDGRWLVPVVRGISFANDDEAEAYLLADNQLTISGGWDQAELAQSLADLAAKGEAMLTGTGFDTDDLDDLLKKLRLDEEDDEPDEVIITDSPEDLLAKYDVATGQIWMVGSGEQAHALAVGDARDPQTLTTLMESVKADAIDGGVFTSPPYAQQRAKREHWYGGVSEEEYVDWWQALQENVGIHLLDGASFFLNIKPNVVDGSRVLYVFDLVLAMVRQWDWLLIDELCWERLSAPGRWHNRFKNGFEPVYQFSKNVHTNFYPEAVAAPGEGSAIHRGNRSTGDYYNTSHKVVDWESVLPSNRIPSFGNAIGAMHPAAFPVGLPSFFIQAFSRPGTTWLDPFAGSGTTGVAASQTDRRSLLIELEPKYAAVALERLSIATGEEPEKLTERIPDPNG